MRLRDALRLFCLLLTIGLFARAQPRISGVATDPAMPFPLDFIRLNVTGEFPTPGYTYSKSPVVAISGSQITVDLFATPPTGIVVQVIFRFNISVDIGKLPVGTFNVVARLNVGATQVSSPMKTFTVTAPDHPLAVLSSASFGSTVSPSGIASAFGTRLAAATGGGGVPALAIGESSVRITDSGGVDYPASLYFVSPSQINFIVPQSVAPGSALVTVMNGDAVAGTGHILVATVAPGLYTANGNGLGPPAALALYALGSNQAFSYVFQCDSKNQNCAPLPVTVPNDESDLYLILFGTGIRGDAEHVMVTIAGTPLTVTFAGAQGQFDGLDQINIKIPRGFQVRGQSTLALQVGTLGANQVSLAFQ
jgi:uncharacterized protein (TIGR03437 family)